MSVTQCKKVKGQVFGVDGWFGVVRIKADARLLLTSEEEEIVMRTIKTMGSEIVNAQLYLPDILKMLKVDKNLFEAFAGYRLSVFYWGTGLSLIPCTSSYPRLIGISRNWDGSVSVIGRFLSEGFKGSDFDEKYVMNQALALTLRGLSLKQVEVLRTCLFFKEKEKEKEVKNEEILYEPELALV